MPQDDRSPLDVLDDAFRSLGADHEPLTLDGGDVGQGLPTRAIPLVELRSMLLHPATGFAARDGALGVLVARAQRNGGA